MDGKGLSETLLARQLSGSAGFLMLGTIHRLSLGAKAVQHRDDQAESCSKQLRIFQNRYKSGFFQVFDYEIRHGG
jgi:hypothetical protein